MLRKTITELLISATRRYMFHSQYRSDNPLVNEIYDMMADMDLDEIWMLTQM